MQSDIALPTMLLAVVLGTLPAAAEESRLTPFAEGKAYDRQSGKLLYIEKHHCHASRQQCTVQYRDTNGALIASKDLDFRESEISPALIMEDHRTARKIRIDTGNEELVIDAGFDNFVRGQWEALDAGERVNFRFQVAGFDAPLAMDIVRSDAPGCTTRELCLEVRADSWLVRAFVEPIQLAYSRTDRKLRRYSGISNLRDEQGESMDVDIFYEYGDTASAPLYAEGVARRL